MIRNIDGNICADSEKEFYKSCSNNKKISMLELIMHYRALKKKNKKCAFCGLESVDLYIGEDGKEHIVR